MNGYQVIETISGMGYTTANQFRQIDIHPGSLLIKTAIDGQFKIVTENGRVRGTIDLKWLQLKNLKEY